MVRLTALGLTALVTVGIALTAAPAAAQQVTAKARAGATPPWTKGIGAITPESYYHAIDCGKQGGEDPPCVFWDTGLCKNNDFELAFYTPYKMVSYAVWRAVQQKKPPPQPNYAEAQRTRVTIGVSPVRGAKNAFTDLILKRGGRTVTPTARLVDNGRGNITYDFPAFAATASISLDIVGKAATVRCAIPRSVLSQFR